MSITDEDMANKDELPEDEFNIYGLWCETESVEKLRDWCNKMIEADKTILSLNIEYGYYSEVDGLKLEASEDRRKNKRP